MSKRRPSEASDRFWRARVFHNTYTRRGQLKAVRGWSVKIQYRGLRRTFSLVARAREGAAAEAREISERLHRQGWDGLAQAWASHQEQAQEKTELGYWKQRLLLRAGAFPGLAASEPSFATRIDHAGLRGFFPLAESDPESAARQALAIYQYVVEHGWPSAHRRFPREICVAFHWAYDPLFWTYTTVYTLPTPRPRPRQPTAAKPCAILLVEPDPAVRRPLALCLEAHPACRCVPCSESEARSRILERDRFVLCLINAQRQEVAHRLGIAQRGGMPVFTYSVHADSDEVFLAPPGGVCGYLLTRQPPQQILAPVLPALEAGLRSTDDLGRAARLFAQRVLERPRPTAEARATAQLTHRELEVLGLLSKGQVDKEIAGSLGISAWTVHDHVKRIFEKLGVHSRLEAVLAYLQK